MLVKIFMTISIYIHTGQAQLQFFSATRSASFISWKLSWNAMSKWIKFIFTSAFIFSAGTLIPCELIMLFSYISFYIWTCQEITVWIHISVYFCFCLLEFTTVFLYIKKRRYFVLLLIFTLLIQLIYLAILQAYPTVVWKFDKFSRYKYAKKAKWLSLSVCFASLFLCLLVHLRQKKKQMPQNKIQEFQMSLMKFERFDYEDQEKIWLQFFLSTVRFSTVDLLWCMVRRTSCIFLAEIFK